MDGNDKKNYSLLSFNMTHDVFREIDGPENPMSKDAQLVLQNDSIAIILYQGSHPFTGSIDLMVMRREGCWTNVLTFDINLLPLWRPLGHWKNNNFVMETSSQSVALYDHVTHQIKELGVYSFHIFNYKESLVSLTFGNKERNRYSLSNVLQDLFKFNAQDLEEDYFWCEGCMHDESHCTCWCQE